MRGTVWLMAGCLGRENNVMTVLGQVAFAQVASVPSRQDLIDSLRVTADSLRTALFRENGVSADSIRRALNGDYIRLLESVNSQHAAWLAPSNFAIAWLTAVITLGGIAVAVILYRQSSEHQKRLDAELSRFSESMDTKVSEANTMVTELGGVLQESQKRSDEVVASLKHLLASAEGDIKSQIETVLKAVQDQQTENTSKIGGVMARATGIIAPNPTLYPVAYTIELAHEPFPPDIKNVIEAFRLLPGIGIEYPVYHYDELRPAVRAYSRQQIAGKAIQHLFEDAGLSVTSINISPGGQWRVDDKWP
jgi:hypothetical protein